MSYHNEEYKQQVYKKWLDSGRPWFDIDKSKEPTYAERQIILEMKKRENSQTQTQARSKPENEIRKFKHMVNDVNYLTNSKKPSSINLDLDMPKDTVTSKSEAIKKYFDELAKT